jgi:restriction system protein
MLDESLAGPKFVQLLEPVLHALRALGGSARPAEVREQVAEDLGMGEGELSELLPSGTARFDNLVAWARFYLVRTGFIDSSRRGVWTLTETGRSAAPLSHEEALTLFRDEHARIQETARENRAGAEEEGVEEETGVEPEGDHRQQVLNLLQDLPAEGFERFCQRLLRESGFQEVTVTGRSGDGGIDGIGVLEVNPLVSFKVLFQCKKYRGHPVVPSQVRDFRGAMQGRADKGIIITTGTFTADARKESLRDGVPPIELVDGAKLIDMLEQLELGLRPVQSFELDGGFFEDYR